MAAAGIVVKDHRVQFGESRECLRIALAQISPAYDQDLFTSDFLVRSREPERQAERIVKVIEQASATGTDLLLFPELVAPFSQRRIIEDALGRTTGDFAACIPYEHTTLADVFPLLSEEESLQHGLAAAAGDTRLVNFSRIFVRGSDGTEILSQIKLTPFSGEFSLSAKDTLVCGRVLHRFVTNWGTFVFLICKDYVGEVRTEPPVPMFDFLKTLTDDGLHYVFVSALNPEPEAFIHAARSFYYLQEKSSHTFSIFLNGAELDHTTVVFPARPHPRVRGAKDVQILPLFETKPGWGTQVRFPGCAERVIRVTLARLDTYTTLPTKEIFSPVYDVALADLADLGIGQEISVPSVSEPPGEPTVEVAEPVRHNLPCFSTAFVGRDTELGQVTGLLDDPTVRLVTLVGPGGAGKSRLAHQAASQRLESFRHGVYFIPLAPVASADNIPVTVADSLSFSLYGREDPRVQLLNYLREKRLLLLLDSFEHLIQGAGIVGEILQAAALVKVLATSRERLNLMGEWTVEVAGLPVPESAETEDADQYGGVRLFVECARRVRAGFVLSSEDREAVVRICRLVDGIPLAIELASSWVRALSCSEILQEMEHGLDLLATSLRDAPERHRSLRAVFDHSWTLLADRERDALKRMSVFRGGFRREAAGTVTGAALPVLSSLVDKSLLRWNPSGRYEMHQLLREYLEQKLAADPAMVEETHQRHCRYYLDFLADRRKELRGEKDQETAEEIGSEIENVRRAWGWAVDHGKADAIDKASNSLHRFYWVRNLYLEGEDAFARAADTLRNSDADRALGKALAGRGAFARALSRYDEAASLLQESLELFRRSGRKEYEAFSLGNLGMVSLVRGRYGEAERLFKDSFALAEQAEDLVEAAEALNGLGSTASRQGRYPEAKEYFQRALSLCKQLGDRRGTASALNNLGMVASLLDEKAEARRLFQEALEIKREQGDRAGVDISLNNLGTIAGQVGDYREAKRIFEENLSIRREMGNQVGVCNSLINLGIAATRLGAHQEARDRLAEALRGAAEIGAEPIALTALVSMAELLLQDDEEQALGILALVLNHPATPSGKRDEAERLATVPRRELSRDTVCAAGQRGKTQDLWELVRDLVPESD
jgi:predicted ATPase/Tfp pilus assembly protein PilF/predicted amidohydrolase